MWSPAGGDAHCSLWLHLRLLWCRAVWVQVCAAGPGASVAWHGVVAMVRPWVSEALRPDWLRMGASLPGAVVLPSWCVIGDRHRHAGAVP